MNIYLICGLQYWEYNQDWANKKTNMKASKKEIKLTVTKRLLDNIDMQLKLIEPKIIFAVNEEYILGLEKKQTEKFAIKFIEWCAENHYVLLDINCGIHLWNNERGQVSTKELLKIYKKEKL